MNAEKDYTLEDAVELNEAYPRTFIIPSQAEKDALTVGMLVKLIFILNTPQDGCGAERMWVEITERNGNTFSGILTNDPRYIESIKAGDIITFESNHIAAIYIEGEAPFDGDKYAIITKRALENRQINQVTRTDDLIDEQDSGWMFSFGDEDDDYYEDEENGAAVLLKDVLCFEPLLERVLGERGYLYEYCEETNEFIRVE